MRRGVSRLCAPGHHYTPGMSRAWSVLGYGSWDEYCTREFGTARLQLPREDRREVVASLRDSGLSTRAIASAVGIDQKTVRNDLAEAPAGEEISSPEPEWRPVDPDEIAAFGALMTTGQHRPPELVTGTDGKTYAPSKPTAPKPRTDIPRVINGALVQIDGQDAPPSAVSRPGETAI